ncbi:hypothetical protein MHU86_1948 [Fragilaria crotonensis]|nr:hypothetical protein MHU86_1948 [Fragilaria crotonensis]
MDQEKSRKKGVKSKETTDDDVLTFNTEKTEEKGKKTEKKKAAKKADKEDSEDAETVRIETAILLKDLIVNFCNKLTNDLEPFASADDDQTKRQYDALKKSCEELLESIYDFHDFVMKFHAVFPTLEELLSSTKEGKKAFAYFQEWHDVCWDKKSKQPMEFVHVSKKLVKKSEEKKTKKNKKEAEKPEKGKAEGYDENAEKPEKQKKKGSDKEDEKAAKKAAKKALEKAERERNDTRYLTKKLAVIFYKKLTGYLQSLASDGDDKARAKCHMLLIECDELFGTTHDFKAFVMKVHALFPTLEYLLSSKKGDKEVRKYLETWHDVCWDNNSDEPMEFLQVYDVLRSLDLDEFGF